MFIYSNITVRALDARNGDLLWSYSRATPLPASFASQPRVPTMDGNVLALEARTGRLKWDHAIIAPGEIGDVDDRADRRSRQDGARRLRLRADPLLPWVYPAFAISAPCNQPGIAPSGTLWV